MQATLDKVRSVGRQLRLSSLFDYLVCAYVVTLMRFRHPIISQDMVMLYGLIALVLFTVMLVQKRDWTSIPLGLLLFWSFINMFDKSLGILEIQHLIMWINWSLLNEGFMFLFFGVLGIISIVKYATSYKLYYVPLSIAFGAYTYKALDIANEGWFGWSMTPIMAMIIAAVAVLFLKKKFGWGFFCVINGVTVVVCKYQWLLYKFRLRPHMWKIAWKDIAKTQGEGRGFDNSVNGINGWLWSGMQDGWAFIQNDLMELGRNLGVIAVLLVVAFFARILITGKKGLAYWFVLSIVISCMFQRTLHFHLQAGIAVVAIALLILETEDTWAVG